MRLATANPATARGSTEPGPTASIGTRVLIVGLAAIGPFSLNIFKPCLPWIKAEFGEPIGTVQLALSLSILAAAIATLLAGPLSDALGRRSVTITCLYVYVASCIVGTAASSIEVLTAARIVQAAASSVAMTVARAIIHDRGRAVGRTIARVTIAAVFAVLLAPALGGLLIDHIGWRAVFGLTAAAGLGLLASAHHLLPPDLPSARRRTMAASSPPRSSAWRLVGSRAFIGYTMQSSLQFAVFFAYTSAAAYLMVDTLGRSAAEYGLWFLLLAAFVVGGLVVAERLVGKVPPGVVAWAG
ncbi:MAG: MFS transporter, partial [Deltaproteobacteria bacterium]|nr:MFS transporter [Deltaproteobacteria bacterium]